MGNACGCGREDPMAAVKLEKMIRIQAVARTFLAMKKKKELKKARMSHLMSKYISWNHNVFVCSSLILIVVFGLLKMYRRR